MDADWFWLAALLGALYFCSNVLHVLRKAVKALEEVNFKLGWICDAMKQHGLEKDPFSP